MSGPRNAQDFVTPQAKYEEHAGHMSGVASPGGSNVMYPLYGLGQASDTGAAAFYSRPLFLVPLGVVLGVGIGYGIWGWFMPRLKKNVRKNMQRGQED